MKLHIILSSLSLVLFSQLAGQTLSPEEILAKCDAARGNQQGIQWKVNVTETTLDRETSRTIRVKARGFDMLAETLDPPRQKGHKLLLVKNNMWFYKPGLSKPVPVSLRQKLTGQAANGDIASTNYASDYEILSITDAQLDGQECYKFQLKAKSRSVTYEFIDYWVLKESHLGIRADYYTSSGRKLLKTAQMSYDNKLNVDGEENPFISEMFIKDTLQSQSLTKLVFTEPKISQLSSRIFNVSQLAR